MDSHNEPTEWEVSFAGIAEAQLRDIFVAAGPRGTMPEFVQMYAEIDRRLRTDPETFGEPRRYHPELNLHQRMGGIRLLMFRYGVHRESRRVFVQQVIELVGRDAAEGGNGSN